MLNVALYLELNASTTTSNQSRCLLSLPDRVIARRLNIHSIQANHQTQISIKNKVEDVIVLFVKKPDTQIFVSMKNL